MPEHDNDRIEQFFRRAAAKADVTFNEEDWKKLEAKLDAADLSNTVVKKAGKRIANTLLVAILFLGSALIWMRSEDSPSQLDQTAAISDPFVREGNQFLPKPQSRIMVPPHREGTDLPEDPGPPSLKEMPPDRLTTSDVGPVNEPSMSKADDRDSEDVRAETGIETSKEVRFPGLIALERDQKRLDLEEMDPPATGETVTRGGNDDQSRQMAPTASVNQKSGDKQTGDEQPAHKPSVDSTGNNAERDKQKAVVELPGAEEEETREALTMVQEEHASNKRKHVVAPRLSLLLSFAPDFSGTSMAVSSAPGKAFGAMLHYHAFSRWSISAGVIKNYKQYTGSGEDYSPPTGYWKYYTNGIIPETIEGTCDILEFPLMVQYNVVQREKGRWNVGIGASSYLMQSESYRYNFAQPNPGAKDGWHSRKSSRFFMNMLNFTVGYEHQILPGLMLGIEPYTKVPLEEIGWSNLKLFSSGVSFTLRYTLLHKNSPIPIRSRGPD